MSCEICHKKVNELFYQVSYPLPISKAQEKRGCPPSGDRLVRVCEKCKTPETRFHNPEIQEIKNLGKK